MRVRPKSPKQGESSLCTCLEPPLIHLMCISGSATALNGLIFHLHSPGCSITAQPWSCPFSFIPAIPKLLVLLHPHPRLLQLGKFRCGYNPRAPNPAGKEQWGAPPAPGAGSGEDSSLSWECSWVGSVPSPALGGAPMVTNSNQQWGEIQIHPEQQQLFIPGHKLGNPHPVRGWDQPCPRCEGRKASAAQSGMFFPREGQLNKARSLQSYNFCSASSQTCFSQQRDNRISSLQVNTKLGWGKEMWFFKVRVFQLEKSTAGFPFSSEELQGGGRKGGADTQVHLKVNRFVTFYLRMMWK